MEDTKRTLIRQAFKQYKGMAKTDLEDIYARSHKVHSDLKSVPKMDLVVQIMVDTYGAKAYAEAFEPHTTKERKTEARRLIDEYHANRTNPGTVAYIAETSLNPARYDVVVAGYVINFFISPSGRIRYEGEFECDRMWLIKEAVRVRYAVVQAGGMATKSFTEDLLMRRFPTVTRHEAHEILNEIESQQIDKRTFWTAGNEPKIGEYPEVELVGKVKRATVKR